MTIKTGSHKLEKRETVKKNLRASSMTKQIRRKKTKSKLRRNT